MELSAAGARMTQEGYFLRVPERGVHALTSRVTEEANLFLLAHMGLAEVDPTSWRLRVEGLVREPASLRLTDLLALPPHEVMSVHECAGSPLTPTVPKRRVGNVVWSGVRLRDVLTLCRVAPGAAFVWTHGLERGDFADLKGEPYVKDLPLWKALSPEVLLATTLNGKPHRGKFPPIGRVSAGARLPNGRTSALRKCAAAWERTSYSVHKGREISGIPTSVGGS